jgi:hypothetical protein
MVRCAREKLASFPYLMSFRTRHRVHEHPCLRVGVTQVKPTIVAPIGFIYGNLVATRDALNHLAHLEIRPANLQ